MKIKKIMAFMTASIMTICLATSSNVQAATTDGATNSIGVNKYTMSDMTTTKIVKDMGLGSNLGNTLDACGDWIQGKAVKDYETAWGAPVTTKAMIDGLHNSGFNTLRIPVAWSNLMAADYTISPELFNRVEEVMNYALDDNMYVVLNIHYDNGWVNKFSTDYDGTMKKYKSVWTQISTRFAKYGDHLILESLNEDGCYNNIWDSYKGTNGKEKAYEILNSVNQSFVDLIRNSGGNNAKRHLLIAGYSTDTDKTCDPLYKMPKDPQNRCAVSIHYYSPFNFVMMQKDETWGKVQTTWGSDNDRKQLANDMNKLKTTFLDKGIPVIIGEYAMCADRTPEMSRLWTASVCKAVYDLGICPILWDTGGYYDRTTCKFRDPELLKQMNAIAGANTATLSDGWYYIKNVNAKKYLQVEKNIGSPCQNVELGTGSGSVGQKWYLTNVGNGCVTLKSALGNYMLDVYSGENKDGSNIEIYNAYSGDPQKFFIKSSSTNGAYAIATMSSNQTKVLDDYNYGTSDGTNVCQWTYTGDINQLWVFEPTNYSAGSDNTATTGNSTSLWTGSASAANYCPAVSLDTKNTGGTIDAGSIVKKDGYFYVEYTGAKNSIQLVLQSWCGGKNWAVVEPTESGNTADGNYYAKFSYSACEASYGSEFSKLNKIIVTSKTESIVAKSLLYKN